MTGEDGVHDVDKLLSARQAAELLRVSERRVRYLAAGGRLPGAWRRGRAWRIPLPAVEGWIEHRSRPRPGPRPVQTLREIVAAGRAGRIARGQSPELEA